MAGKESSWLEPEARAKLLKEVDMDTTGTANPGSTRTGRSRRRPDAGPLEEAATAAAVAAVEEYEAAGPNVDNDNEPPSSGCYICKLDNDHPKLLLCEGCNGEYHIYCLTPKLKAIPKDDWYCEACKPKPKKSEGDGLEQLVSALPPSYTSRFGEICWAQGGVGFGWWPSCIYDPRLTLGQARQEARKNLGKKHLVYFFECHGSPFAVLTDNKIMMWEEGISDDFHLGRSARNQGKLRYEMFQHGLQSASIEESKPVSQRLDWNYSAVSDPLHLLPSPVKQQSPVKKKEKRRRDRKRSREEGTRSAEGQRSALKIESEPEKKRAATGVAVIAAPAKKPEPKANLNVAFGAAAGKSSATVNQIEATEDCKMVCKIIKKGERGEGDKSIGFLILKSRMTSTFVDARLAMVEEGVPINMDYRFFVPNLGPVSLVQEIRFGPMLAFLETCAPRAVIGDGSFENPVMVIVVDAVVI